MLKKSSFIPATEIGGGISKRRKLFFAKTRELLKSELLNADGSGRIPQFNAPWREPVWCLAALYSGDKEDIDLANSVLANYPKTPASKYKDLGIFYGGNFGIFQSNIMAGLLHRFGHLMNDEARKFCQSHCEKLFSTRYGSGQVEYNFHGVNDNMPMMSTYGLILGGEAMGNEQAVKHGLWKLHQFRRHLSRCAWASEYNSSTYTAVTLAGAARIASFAHDEEIRQLALEIEQRLWTEVILHFHPGTFMQSGPHCRAYSIDDVGHTHSLQAILWLVFGPEISGRDLIQSYFAPDGKEVLHFCGNPAQSIAEYVDMLECDFHLPEQAYELMSERAYPAHIKGRTEIMSIYDDFASEVHTTTYMQENYSLGTSTLPLCGGDQTNQFYATYKRKPSPESFKDAAPVLCKYFIGDTEMGAHQTSEDGKWSGEAYQKNLGWLYAIQQDNTAMVTGTPSREEALETDTLKLDIIFPAQYGNISASIIGDSGVKSGAAGESAEVVPVSVEAGEVFMHIQPLLPTNLPRKAALRFKTINNYEMLELVNYEGESRNFSQVELSHVLNGFVFTIEDKSKFSSFEEFHQQMSDCRIVDYLFNKHRFINFQRDDVDIDLTVSLIPFGVQTEAINGRVIERPFFACNQLDVSKLPFMSGKVERNFPFFPWDGLETSYFDGSWMVGSDGITPNYGKRQEFIKIDN